ncbi:MAG: hypothetical protein OEX00_03545 [Gammaproteobacteria bacterium]|nr:hypothetical protein [Gammaproteobacteria bacterium]MDH5692569.1 hypothetical protein [Gammaproteobacteria bacterium]
MTELVLKPTSVAQWQALINEACSSCQLSLNEDQESYLVFLLMRFLERTELVNRVIALDFLRSASASGSLRCEQLRDVGDQCLLYSGFFPNRAEKKRVKVSYFVKIGQSAYNQLSTLSAHSLASLYNLLAKDFVSLMDVLQAVRAMGSDTPLLEPLTAMELWQDTGSKMALQSLQEGTQHNSVAIISSTKSKH